MNSLLQCLGSWFCCPKYKSHSSSNDEDTEESFEEHIQITRKLDDHVLNELLNRVEELIKTVEKNQEALFPSWH